MSRALTRPNQRARDEIVNALSTLPAPARDEVLRVVDVAIMQLGLASHLEAAICVLATLAEKRELDRLDVMRELRERFGLKRSKLAFVGVNDDEEPSEPAEEATL